MNEITKAKYMEWLSSLLGACLISFGLGVAFAKYFNKFTLLLILVGVIIHGYGMTRIHLRNRKEKK